jgi:hypothetical protein
VSQEADSKKWKSKAEARACSSLLLEVEDLLEKQKLKRHLGGIRIRIGYIE